MSEFIKSVLDSVALLNYVAKTLPTVTGVITDGVRVTISFSSSLLSSQATTLASLVAFYTDPVVGLLADMPLSTFNSTHTPLTSNAVYVGNWEPVTFASIIVSAVSNTASSVSGLKVQFGSISQQEDNTRCFSVSSGTALSVTLATQGNWMRVVYTNGATVQEQFALQVRTSSIQLVAAAAAVPVDDGGAEQPSDQSTSLVEVDVESITTPLIQIDLTRGLKDVTTSGTASQSTEGVSLTSGSLSSKQYVSQSVGSTVKVLFSASLGPNQIIGIGTSVNGLFVGCSGSKFGVIVRSAGVDTWTLSTAFNTDKVNGTTTITLNPLDTNTYEIRYGKGVVLFKVAGITMHKITADPVLGCVPLMAQADTIPMTVSYMAALCDIPFARKPTSTDVSKVVFSPTGFTPLLSLAATDLNIFLKEVSCSVTSDAIIALFEDATLDYTQFTDGVDKAAPAMSGGVQLLSTVITGGGGVQMDLNGIIVSPGSMITIACKASNAKATVCLVWSS